MTITQFFLVLRARWRELALILVLALAAAVLAAVLLPKQYTATSSLLVDEKTVDPLTGNVLPQQQFGGHLATQMDVAQSDRVLLRVVRSMNLLEAPEFGFREQWQKASNGQGDYESWVIEELRKYLNVLPSRESGVMTIAFTAWDRELAARMANAVVQSYVDTSLELRLEPAKNYSTLFGARVREVRANMEAAQAKLAEFQRAKGMIVSDERMDLESTRLAELSTQLVSLQGLAAESGSRQRQADANTERMPEVLNNLAVSGLTQELSRQQAKLSELSSRLGDEHPQMVELKANVAQLRTQIERESRKISGSVGVNNAVNQTRIAQLRSSIDEQRNRVLQLRSLRDEASVLLRDVQNGQRGYDAVLARAGQNAFETQNHLANVSVLKRATAPALPSAPRPGLLLALGLVLGTIAGLAYVLATELARPRLRSTEDIEDVLGLSLLVEIPRRVNAAKRFGKSSAPLESLRLSDRVGGLALPNRGSNKTVSIGKA